MAPYSGALSGHVALNCLTQGQNGDLVRFQHLQPGGPGVFHQRRNGVAPCEERDLHGFLMLRASAAAGLARPVLLRYGRFTVSPARTALKNSRLTARLESRRLILQLLTSSLLVCLRAQGKPE